MRLNGRLTPVAHVRCVCVPYDCLHPSPHPSPLCLSPLHPGKSTLMDLLTFRKTGGVIRGDYFVGAKHIRPKHKWSCYVTQDNVHIPTFTVRSA